MCVMFYESQLTKENAFMALHYAGFRPYWENNNVYIPNPNDEQEAMEIINRF